MNLRLTSRAYSDLAQIAAYLTEEAPGAAQSVMERIERTLDTIVQFPLMGRPGRRPNTREVVVPRLPFLVVYRIAGGTVEVLTIFHTSRDPNQI